MSVTVRRREQNSWGRGKGEQRNANIRLACSVVEEIIKDRRLSVS